MCGVRGVVVQCVKVGGCGCACSVTVGGVVEIQSVMVSVSWSSAVASTLSELRLCRMIVPVSFLILSTKKRSACGQRGDLIGGGDFKCVPFWPYTEAEGC